MRVDLNADIGESFGVYRSGEDERLVEHITSGSIACGFHAGDPGVMRRTVRLAARHGVAVGAHPAFADLVGFGRREMHIEPSEIADLVLYQVGALDAIARAEGVRLQHVKPHGALYHMSAGRPEIAEAVARAVASLDDGLILVGPPGSALLEAGRRLGLRAAAEAFADRSYEPDGALTPRAHEDAVIGDPDVAGARALRMVRDGRTVARDGSVLPMHVDTICVHSDTPGAAAIAAAVRTALIDGGVRVAPMGAQ